MSLLRQFLFLAIAGNTVALASSNAHPFPGFASPWLSGWAAADFNGDSQIDLATASAGLHDGRGYEQQVSINLGSLGNSSFTFRSLNSKVRVRAQDMDGDDDRDIVIFEGHSAEPIGVWLNDGDGHFEQADLEQFRSAFTPSDSGSLRGIGRGPDDLLAISEQRAQLAIPAFSISQDAPVLEAVPVESVQILTFAHRFHLRNRAPPSHS